MDFRREGADNVRWVWCPYAVRSRHSGERAEVYFPGVQNVDWLALDGYNWGNTRCWARWESFREIFEPAYERLRRLTPIIPL